MGESRNENRPDKDSYFMAAWVLCLSALQKGSQSKLNGFRSNSRLFEQYSRIHVRTYVRTYVRTSTYICVFECIFAKCATLAKGDNEAILLSKNEFWHLFNLLKIEVYPSTNEKGGEVEYYTDYINAAKEWRS